MNAPDTPQEKTKKRWTERTIVIDGSPLIHNNWGINPELVSLAYELVSESGIDTRQSKQFTFEHLKVLVSTLYRQGHDTTNINQTLEMIQKTRPNTDDRKPLPFNNKWISVVGTGGNGVTRRQSMVCEHLGKLLANEGYGLISGGWPGVDHAISKSFAEQLEYHGITDKNSMIQLLTTEQKAEYSYGKVEIVENDEAWFEYVARTAFALIMIGGEGGTYKAYKTARNAGVPILPIPGTLGDAKAAYEEEMADPGELPFSKTQLEKINIAIGTVNDAKQAAGEIINLLNEINQPTPHNGIPEQQFKKIVQKIYTETKTVVPDDLQKNRWGGKDEVNNRKLIANVTSRTEGFFKVELVVQSTSPDQPLTGNVAFFIHDTFENEIVYAVADDSVAKMEVVAYEAFTAGAYTEDGTILELDLNEIKSFPSSFYYPLENINVKRRNIRKWTNAANTFTQDINNLFEIKNGNTKDIFKDYNDTTAAIQKLLGRAILQQKTLRAIGTGWSSSKVAAADGWLLDTKQLNMLFQITNKSSIANNYRGKPEQLLFSQCGTTIEELNNWLQKNKRALKTSGSSNQQTIVGAISTGTHGSAIDFGSMQDFIVGMHIIVSPTRSVWLERSSYYVAGTEFLRKFDCELVMDDDMFNAALVSFGSFGFIHGVMLETEEIFSLEYHRQVISLKGALKYVTETLDFQKADFIKGKKRKDRPYHFHYVMDPAKPHDNVYVTIMYKQPYTKSNELSTNDIDRAGPAGDAAVLLGIVMDRGPAVSSKALMEWMKDFYPVYPSPGIATSAEIFNNAKIRGNVLSSAIAIPLSHVGQANELLADLCKINGTFTGAISFRYTHKSSALLAFTKFDNNCIVELDGINSPDTMRFFEAVWNGFRARGIPYTFHWGKINNLDAQKLREMYQANVDIWIAARTMLLPPESLKVFNTKMMEELGLTAIPSRQVKNSKPGN